jgi:hypothetical protein
MSLICSVIEEVSRKNCLPYVIADYLKIIIHTVTNHVLYT